MSSSPIASPVYILPGMVEKRDWPKELEASIQRVQEAIAKGQKPAGPLLQAVITAAGAHVNQKIQRQRERDERRRRRNAEEALAAGPRGFVFAGASLVMLYFALTQPGLWWMIFVAFGFAMASATLIAKARRRARDRAGAAPAAGAEAEPESDPALAQLAAREKRVDATCERLLGELKSGPQAVRDFVQRPEETIKALRSASHELARRERELRTALTAEDDQRLRKEHSDLEERVAAEKDQVARARFAAALKALDGQLTQRAELATAAMRFEAEGTRILYSLESLRTQILRARSADAASADVVGAGLRQSLEQIGHEMDAVAEALEAVHRGDVAPVVDVGGEPGPGAPPERVRDD